MKMISNLFIYFDFWNLSLYKENFQFDYFLYFLKDNKLQHLNVENTLLNNIISIIILDIIIMNSTS